MKVKIIPVTTESQLYMSMTAPCPSDTDPREQQVTYHDSGLNYTTGFGGQVDFQHFPWLTL